MNKNIKKPLVIVVSGPSGSGKTSLIKKAITELNLDFSISTTTREQKEGEKDGKDYYFVNKNNFEKYIKENKFIEYEEIFGNMYGTSYKSILEKVNQGKDIILDIDYKGYFSLKKKYEGKILSFFIMPPTLSILKERLKDRKRDSKDSLNLRISRSIIEMEKSFKYDYSIVNDDFNLTFSAFKSLIIKEKNKNTI